MYKLKFFCSQQITIGKVSFTTVVQNFQEHWMLNKKKNVLAFHKKKWWSYLTSFQIILKLKNLISTIFWDMNGPHSLISQKVDHKCFRSFSIPYILDLRFFSSPIIFLDRPAVARTFFSICKSRSSGRFISMSSANPIVTCKKKKRMWMICLLQKDYLLQKQIETLKRISQEALKSNF